MVHERGHTEAGSRRNWHEDESMEGKKLVVYVVLLVVVVAAVALTVKRVASKPGPPNWVLDQQVQKIDSKTQEVVTESVRDWTGKYAPDETGRWKNPKAGTYTMVDPMKCESCGATIPVPDYSTVKMIPDNIPLPPGADASKTKQPMIRDPVDMDRIRREYKCPKCGKSPSRF